MPKLTQEENLSRLVNNKTIENGSQKLPTIPSKYPAVFIGKINTFSRNISRYRKKVKTFL